MVEFLLQEKANPFITSCVGKDEYETVLEAACRWNYTRLIHLYLNKFKWDMDTLKRASKLCSSKEAKQAMKQATKNFENKDCCLNICKNKRNEKVFIINDNTYA